MKELSSDLVIYDNSIERIYLPKVLLPSTGFGEIKLTIKDGRIVDCKTTTSHKIISDIKPHKV